MGDIPVFTIAAMPLFLFLLLHGSSHSDTFITVIFFVCTVCAVCFPSTPSNSSSTAFADNTTI